MQNLTFTFESVSAEPYDCECCGTCYPEGVNIYFNDQIVWSRFFDGHLGGEYTDESILDCIIKAYHDYVVSNLELEFTEEARLNWNKQHPGNYIASNCTTWNEQKQTSLKYHIESLEQIKECCKNLPENELICLKMIALWFQEVTGYEIKVNISEKYLSEDY